jgi:hypothetical protein
MAGRLDKDVVAKARKVLRNKKVLTVDEVAKLMNCSLPTTRKQLKEWNVYTSYNKNARYYALPDVPEFDDNGMWVYKQIRFSKHGNLGQTLIHIITHSEAGLDGSQIEQLIRVPSKSFLSLFRNTPELRREKYEGCYVYFSADEQVYARQKDQRLKLIRGAKMPSEMEAVLILAEIIKHPDWDINRIAASLKRQKYPVTPRMVQNLLDAHGLDGQKKGPRFP